VSIPDHLTKWLPLVKANAEYHRLDPLLVLALISRETDGRNIVGDHGYGVGLGQADKRSHHIASCEDDRGRLVCLIPGVGIAYTCHLLATLLANFKGDSAAALAAYNAGEGAVKKVIRVLPPDATQAERLKAVDRITAHGNYSSDVLARREAFSARAA
jgi:soluble lytic murein transglycosylase-like protein